MAITYHSGRRIQGLSLTAGSEVGETSGTSESKTLGVTGSRYRGGIKIATGSALIGQTLSPTRGIKFELKRTGLSGVHSLSRFEIWNNETIISSATVTFQPDSKVGTSYAYVEFFPNTTVTLQANDRITIATDGGVTNYYTFRSNASGTYDTTKTHWTESTYNAGSGGTWADDTGIDGNFKFTLADVGDTKPTKTTPTFEDDFSTDNWTDNGATTHVTGGSLVWNSDTTDNGCSLDMLGSTISDTAWVARFKFTVANFDSGTGNHQFQFLVSDKANLDVATTSRDSLGFKIIKATSDEYALAWKNGGTISTNTEVAFAHSAQAETIYVEMSRLSSTSFKVEFFSDSSYTTSIESETATISGVVDLRYLIAIEQDINGSATMNGTINNFEFYNGHTSVSANAVQSGSRYEETDTRKIYYKDDISYKELDGAEATNYRSASWYEQLSGETP